MAHRDRLSHHLRGRMVGRDKALARTRMHKQADMDLHKVGDTGPRQMRMAVKTSMAHLRARPGTAQKSLETRMATEQPEEAETRMLVFLRHRARPDKVATEALGGPPAMRLHRMPVVTSCLAVREKELNKDNRMVLIVRLGMSTTPKMLAQIGAMEHMAIDS